MCSDEYVFIVLKASTNIFDDVCRSVDSCWYCSLDDSNYNFQRQRLV